MKLRFSDRKAERGFRLSVLDVAFILVIGCVSCALYIYLESPEVALIPAHLCAVFFLFCNVFRVRTRQEVVWVASYIVACSLSLVTGLPFWPVVLAITTPVILAVVIWAILSGGYRGILLR